MFHLIQFHEEDCYYSSLGEGEADRKIIYSGFQVAEPGFQKVFKLSKSVFFSLPSCLSDSVLGRTDDYISFVKKLIIIPELVMV